MKIATKEEKNSFSMVIEQRALDQGISFMEAILDYCEECGLEVELAATLLNPSLKFKIESEARDLRYLPKK